MSPLENGKTQLLEVLTELVAEAVIAYDREFKVLVFNQQAEDIFNIKANEIIGQNFTLERAQEPKWQVLSPIIYSSLAPTVVRLSEVGVSPDLIKVILDNPRREYEVATTQVGDLFLKVIKDQTREAELLKAKSEFITIAGHQLRPPPRPLTGPWRILKRPRDWIARPNN